MPVTATPSNPTSVYELQVFTRTLTLSTACTLLSYTVYAPSQSVITITISSTTLTISGYYDNIFNLQEWRYRTNTNDSTEYTTSVYYGSLPSVYYKATGYRPDTRTSSSIAINVRTSQGDLDFLHYVKNDWNQKRNRLLNFIRGSTIDAEEPQVDIELDLPAGTITGGEGGGGGTPVTGYNFGVTITSNTQYYNIKSAAIDSGWDQVLPLFATITIANGVYVWSDDTASAALVTGSTFPTSSTISIVNNGYIMGKGGAGGGSGSTPGNGSNGGPAISLGYNINLTNNSYIGGGGGGGACFGGGGAGGAQGGSGGTGSSPGGAGGLPGSAGSNGSVQSGAACGAGGGGRIMPGTGGAAATFFSVGGRGGGSGGGGGGFKGSFNPSGSGGNGGSAGDAGQTGTGPADIAQFGSGYGGGGGGWGAAGGAHTGNYANFSTPGAGGRAITLNGFTVTYATQGTIYGAVS